MAAADLMLLAVDAGNSSVTFGVFQGSQLVARFFMPYAKVPASAAGIRAELGKFGILPATLTGVALASVGPRLTELQEQLAELSPIPVFTLRVDTTFGMPIAYPNPAELGVDRWLNAIAAYDAYAAAVLVVDIGTATNFDCVSPKGEFLGGAICVGPQLSLDALAQRSSKLIQLTLEPPRSVLASNTREALQSGAYFGHAELIDGMVERLSAAMPAPPTVIGTGGFVRLFAPLCRTLNVIDPDLTLKGACLAWQRRPQ